jgi:hypothetical protein
MQFPLLSLIREKNSYLGGAITDSEILEKLPTDYRELLQQANGFILFNGGLHVRGAVLNPNWHSVRYAWLGECALHQLFPAIEKTDVPFSEDCVGDQFLLRSGSVYKLEAETGTVVSTEMDFATFLRRALDAPLESLGLHPLLRFQHDGGTLEPGQLLSVYPPFCTKESAQGVSLRAIPALERISFLADFARQIANLPEGTKVRIKTAE